MSWLQGLLAPFTALTNLVGGYIERKQRIAEVKATGEVRIEEARANAEVARLNKVTDGEINWDQSAVDQMRFSWKDEYFVIVWTAPLWLAMLPFQWADEASNAFFETISNAPQWYVYGMATMIAASFGVRKLIDLMKARGV
jgi:hypothetical protein